MTAHTSVLPVRVNDDFKEQANQALTAMGLLMSDAVRQFLRGGVTDQAFSRALKVPNVHARVAMDEWRAMITNRRAGFAADNALFANVEKNSGQ